MAYTARFDEGRWFGVEIEVCEAKRSKVIDSFADHGLLVVAEEYRYPVGYWTLTDDGSIAGPYPAELISPIVGGYSGLQTVSQAVKALAEAGCMVGKDCGLHVHWSARDFTGNQLLSLLRLYTKYEKVIDYLVAPHRRENKCSFARTMWHKDRKPKGRKTSVAWVDDLAEWKNPLAAEIAVKFTNCYSLKRASSFPSARHHKLNLCSLMSKETVEFRQHQSVLDEREVLEWIVLTQLMVTRAKNVKTDSEMKDISLNSFMRVLGLSNQYNPINILEGIQERYYQNKDGKQGKTVLSDHSEGRKSRSDQFHGNWKTR